MIHDLIRRIHKPVDLLPYNGLALIYDRVMDHIEYEQWAFYLLRLFKTFGQDIHRVVDGGCGTGRIMEVLENHGYRCAGFDRSLGMVRIARSRTESVLWQGDLRDLSLAGGWDAFLCVYDTIQYLKPDEIPLVFEDVYDRLRFGGLFIFDMITEHHARTAWGHYTEVEKADGFDWTRSTWYDRHSKQLHTKFEIHRKGQRSYREHHKQYVYTLDEMRSLAEAGGFRVRDVLNDFTLNPGSERSDRIHFILQKEAD